jgi:apolipoprotein N-acyltransferase
MSTRRATSGSPRHAAGMATGDQAAANGGRRDWLLATGSALLLWLAFPPVNAWPLAWVATCGWLRLIRQREWQASRPYVMLYVAGLSHWLLMIHWVRLPHWSAYFGWLALAAYLAVYVASFIAIARVLVHRWGLSSVLAAPVVWTGLELARARLFSGLAISLLGHTQLPLLPLVQIADLVGAYGVSFLVMLVAACLERLVPFSGERRVIWPCLPAMIGVLGCLLYGVIQLRPPKVFDPPTRPFRVALIQGALDTQFDGDTERDRRSFFDYARLSREAIAQYGEVDLMIWPESMFTGTEPMITYEPPLRMIPGWDGNLDQLQRRLEEHGESVRGRFAWVAQQVHSPLLVGLAWDHYVDGRARRFNSAVLADRDGQILDRYDKMHLVMFGEYVPLGRWFPWLYGLTPMSDGLTAGRQPKAFAVGNVLVAATICFENTVPHLMRRQVRQLQRQGESPDVLVTITNDGWFWGSSLLDLHLACGVFRAIELRRPLLIAANTGFSAWIDPSGRLLSRGPRRVEVSLLAEVDLQQRFSPYLVAGDWIAGL